MKALTNSIAALTTFSDSHTSTVWENMEDHNSFNLRSIEPTDKTFSETIKPCYGGSLYSTVGDDFYSPEQNETETEYLKNDILDVLESDTFKDCSAASAAFISKEQKQLNLSYFTKKIQEAKTLGQIGYIGYYLHFAIDNSKRTFETPEGEEITVPTFLPKDTMSSIWEVYNLKKESLTDSIEDFKEELSKASTLQELEDFRIKFFKAQIKNDLKTPVWTAYKAKKAHAYAMKAVQEVEEEIFSVRSADSLKECKDRLFKLVLKKKYKDQLWDTYRVKAHSIYNPGAALAKLSA